MPFAEDPAHLAKSRLKSDLIAHNVELPPAASKKRVYVELHLKSIDHKCAADFSSDDEDQVQDVTDPKDAGLLGPHSLTDGDLKASLLKYGVKAGPILASTRPLYERKLRKLLQSDGHDRLNGAEKGGLYSDSEEEGNDGNEEEGENESGAEQEQQEIVEESNQSQKQSKERACPSTNEELSSKWNSRNVLKSSKQTRSHCSQIPAGISRVFSINQRQGLRSGVPSGSQSVGPSDCTSLSTQAFSITQMMESQRSPSTCINECELISSDAVDHGSRSNRLDTRIVEQYRPTDQSLYYTPKDSSHALEMKEPLNAILKDIFPDTKTTPTGIYATCRRPIKGAAQRPIKYSYPDTPVSPVTLERQELERRLVPIKLQILVFFVVACILYLIYVHVEDSNIVLTLLDTLNQWSDIVFGFLFQDETQDTQAIGEE